MGFFSKLQKISETVEGINEVAGNVSKSTVTDYGEPVYSLYTALNLGNIHRKIDVTDEKGNIKYFTKSSVIAVKGKTDIMDANGNQIAHLEKKPISMHEKRYVSMKDGTNFTLSNELFHIVKDITNIEELGWQMKGNFIGLNFNILDENGKPVATVGKKMISMHDKYCIDIYQPDKEQLIVAIVIQLEKMLEDRSENESSSKIQFGNFGND